MTEKIKQQLGRLEESLGLGEPLRVRVRIAFVSTDGSRSAPMTLEEIREQREGTAHGR